MKRLLLVDDEPRNLALLAALLAPLGYELVQCGNGRDALARFREARPDLVLLDVAMPGLDGIEVLHAMRNDSSLDYVPVILITAHTEREQRVRGLQAGADEFLEQPIDAPILIARVRSLLQLKDSRDLLAARNIALESLQRGQRELMSFIVHDLKNPLSVALMNADFARGQVVTNPTLALEALVDADRALNRLQDMIEDLLLASRLEEAEFALHPESIAIGELLADILKVYSRMADERHVVLTGTGEVELRVHADRTLLRRVIENLLDNALRHTPSDGHVAIAARADHGIEIAIRNTGAPIPVGERDRIFEKFARGRTEDFASGHAGLGLYFCRRALQACGGGIEVVETAEWPTSFVLHLPS